MSHAEESRPPDFPIHVKGFFTDDEQVTSTLSQPSLVVQRFSGDVGQTAVLPRDSGALLLVGLGARGACDVESARRSLAACRLPAGSAITSDIAERLSEVLPVSTAARVVAAAYAELGLAPDGSARMPPAPHDALTVGIRRGRLEAEAVLAARAWTNAPATDLTPAAFAREARGIAAREGLAIDILGPEVLAEQGFGGLLGVGAGSPHPPHLVDLRFEPPGARTRICLVGKGVTFDTGGLSLKSPAAMSSMRMDKAGASAVLAVMSVVARLGAPVAVRGLMPLAENMIGPAAIRPGDIVTAWGGTRIQVMDTDFEGRVMLADALAYASAEQPDALIDIATLTYQVVTALGPDIGGLISRTDDLAHALAESASEAGEPLWRLPYADRYREAVITKDGVKNHPESDSGRALTAALFLGQFVSPTVPWAHLDITGPAWVGKASDAGATGFGVRTLLQFIQRDAVRPG